MTSTSPRPPSLPGSQPQSPAPKFAGLAASSVPPNVDSTSLSLPPNPPHQAYSTDLTTSHQQPFQPFFTLIADTSSSTTYHPRQIHYLFSDDDTEILTNACLDSSVPPHPNEADPISPSSSREHPPTAKLKSRSKQPRSNVPKERENRVLVLDVDESGSLITKAHSLTPSWQILSTTLAPAPTWEAPNTSQTEGANSNGGMMLRVEGTDGSDIGREHRNVGLGIDGGAVEEEDFGTLMAEFDERMRLLRTIVEAGGGFVDQDVNRADKEDEETVQLQVEEPKE